MQLNFIIQFSVFSHVSYVTETIENDQAKDEIVMSLNRNLYPCLSLGDCSVLCLDPDLYDPKCWANYDEHNLLQDIAHHFPRFSQQFDETKSQISAGKITLPNDIGPGLNAFNNVAEFSSTRNPIKKGILVSK